MTLRETLKRHALGPLTRADHFGEIATYHFEDGSEDRSVRVTIDRLDLVQEADGNVARMTANVFIPNDATLGVETVAKGDEITFAMKLGGEETRNRIARIISSDEGGFDLELIE
jgi:hypothetical protein